MDVLDIVTVTVDGVMLLGLAAIQKTTRKGGIPSAA